MKTTTELHLIRAVYFVQCLVACCVSNFLVLYLSHRGLDVHQVGIIIGTVYPFAQMIGQPLWTALADCTGRHKLCMLTSLVTGTIVVFCMLYMKTFLHIAITMGAGALLMAGVNPLLDNTTLVLLEHHGVDLSNYGRFRVFGAIGWGISALGLGPLIDRFGVPTIFYAFAVTSVLWTVLIAVLPFRNKTKNHAGRTNRSTSSSTSSERNHDGERGHSGQREGVDTYGSIQHAQHHGDVVAVVRDMGDELRDIDTDTAPLLQRQCTRTQQARGRASQEQRHDNQQQQQRQAEEETEAAGGEGRGQADGTVGYLRRLLTRKYTLLFFFMVVSMGVGKGIIDAFLFLYLQDMDAPATLMGLTLAVTTVSEIPFFFFSGDLLNRCGPIFTVALALCAYAGRLLYYSQLTRAWLVLPIELLHGLTFGLSWAAVASYSYQISPKGYEATTQGITSALFWGLGFGLGACGGGFVNQAYGYVFLFFLGCAITASACIIGILWYAIETRWCRGSHPHQRQTEAAPAGAAGTP